MDSLDLHCEQSHFSRLSIGPEDGCLSVAFWTLGLTLPKNAVKSCNKMLILRIKTYFCSFQEMNIQEKKTLPPQTSEACTKADPEDHKEIQEDLEVIIKNWTWSDFMADICFYGGWCLKPSRDQIFCVFADWASLWRASSSASTGRGFPWCKCSFCSSEVIRSGRGRWGRRGLWGAIWATTSSFPTLRSVCSYHKFNSHVLNGTSSDRWWKWLWRSNIRLEGKSYLWLSRRYKIYIKLSLISSKTSNLLHITEADDEISFNPDDIITNVEMIDEGWWKGQCHGHIGLFPAAYVELLQW